MAKRTRGSTRPGQQRPIQRTAARPARPDVVIAPRPKTLTPDEEARAAELEAKIVAEERAAEDNARQVRDRGRRTEAVEPIAARGGSSLAMRASEEYQYVIRDVRRIAIIAGSLSAVLIGLWVAMQVSGSAI